MQCFFHNINFFTQCYIIIVYLYVCFCILLTLHAHKSSYSSKYNVVSLNVFTNVLCTVV